MGIALQVLVNLSKLLESQDASACDAACVKWMVDLVKEHRPSLLDVSDPGNAHTMAVSIFALDLAAGKLPDDGIGRRRRREINGALAQALRIMDEQRLATGLSEAEVDLVKHAKVRLGGGRVQAIVTDVQTATAPAAVRGAWGAISAGPRLHDIDAVRDLRVGGGLGDEDLVRLALPDKDEIRTENLDPSVQAILSENATERRVDWVGMALIGVALVIPPMGLFMSGAAWAMEHKGRSMVLAALSVAGSLAWAMAS